MKQASSTAVNPEQRQAVVCWLQAKVDEVPEELRASAARLIDELASPKSTSQARRSWLQLGRALGIVASSEKRRSSRPTGGTRGGSKPKPNSERERLEQELEETDASLDRDMSRRRKKQRKKARLKRRLKKLLAEQPPKAAEQPGVSSPQEDDELDVDETTPIDDIPLTDEDRCEIRASTRATTGRMALGDGADPAFRPALETLMTSSPVATFSEPVDVPATLPAGVDDEAVAHTMHQTRIRYDVSLSVTQINLNVEKKVVIGKDGHRHVYSGSTSAFGPPRYPVTWCTLATLAVLIGQFAMPMNRLATLLSTAAKRFTTGSLGRMAHYIAERLQPIYLALAAELADAESFAGDDTPSRVIEVSRFFSDPPESGQRDSRRRPPWADFSTRASADATFHAWHHKQQEYDAAKAAGGRSVQMARPAPVPLCVQVGRELTFESDRRNGEGKKQSLNTTVVTGRSDADNPDSQIIFYRSHLGSFGNLMEDLLRKRDKRQEALTILSDLSTTNLVTDDELLSLFKIALAGCSAHARRPFALHEADDPIDADLMLSYFGTLALHERCLTRLGRNRENVQAVRSVDSASMWEEIKRLALEMCEKWSSSTPLGKACRYILKNLSKLTAYLSDPTLDWTNNFCERLLRPEKMIEKSSLFRQTLEGRVVLDILRTVIQTACASGVGVHDYLVSVLMADPDDVRDNPHRYTPLAWSARQADNESP